MPFRFETGNRFDQNNGFGPAGDVATDLKDCFDLRYEKPAEISKVMTISLRDRVIDQPAKAVGLIRSLEHARRRIESHD